MGGQTPPARRGLKVNSSLKNCTSDIALASCQSCSQCNSVNVSSRKNCCQSNCVNANMLQQTTRLIPVSFTHVLALSKKLYRSRAAITSPMLGMRTALACSDTLRCWQSSTCSRWHGSRTRPALRTAPRGSARWRPAAAARSAAPAPAASASAASVSGARRAPQRWRQASTSALQRRLG